MRLCVLSTVLLTIASVGFGEECPEVAKGEKKFVVYNAKVNWFKALLNCSSQGMSLATIESQQEQDMIQDLLAPTCPNKDCHTEWWLGGADLQKEGEYVWFSANQPMEYRNFQEGEPNNLHYWTGDTEDCVQMAHGGKWNYTWNDRICDSPAYFICEYFEQLAS